MGPRGALGPGALALAIALAAFASPLGASAPAPEAAAAERAWLEAINRDRAELGLVPLAPEPALSDAALLEAEELGRGGDLEGEAVSIDRLGERLEAAGYEPRQVFLAVTSSYDPPEELATVWALESPAIYQRFLEPGLRDFGLGLSRLGGRPLYVLVAADSYRAERELRLAELADLEAVQGAILDAVNRERGAEGRAPLRRQGRLDTTAQRYAEQMLAEGFYGHVAPDGTTVLERAKAAGYRPQRVGENLAYGHLSVEEVMAGWMASPPHRANLLDPAYTDFGAGLAHGETEEGFEILWVQVFGRPR